MAVQRLWTPAAEAVVTGRGYDPAGEVRPDGGRTAAGTDLVDLLVAGVLCNDARAGPARPRTAPAGAPSATRWRRPCSPPRPGRPRPRLGPRSPPAGRRGALRLRTEPG